MKILIEQINRDEAFEACESCKTELPHLHFYIETNSKRFKTYEECEANTRKEMISYSTIAEDFPQEFHSFNGGKSKDQFLSEDNIKRAVDRAWKNNHALVAQRIQCRSLKEKHIDDLIKQSGFKGFIKV
jgi:hypothetical protein